MDTALDAENEKNMFYAITKRAGRVQIVKKSKSSSKGKKAKRSNDEEKVNKLHLLPPKVTPEKMKYSHKKKTIQRSEDIIKPVNTTPNRT